MMNQRIDEDIIKYYEVCRGNYDKSSGNTQYNIAHETVASLKKNGARVCRYPMITELMERIIQEQQSPEIIACLFKSINDDPESIISSKCASHLLEKVLYSCKNSDIATDEDVQFQSDKFSEYMWLHYPDYLEHTIGSHIVRLFFQFVCGVYIIMEGRVYSPTGVIDATPMQSDHNERLSSLVKRFLMSPNIDQILANELMSATLQIILVLCSVRNEELFAQVSTHLMSTQCGIENHVSKKDSTEIPSTFMNQHKSYLIECLILSLPQGKLYSRFSKKYLRLCKDSFISSALANPICCAILKATIVRNKNTEILQDAVVCVQKHLVKEDQLECGNVFLNLLIEFIKKCTLFPANEHESLRKYKLSLSEIIQHLSKVDNNELSLSKLLTVGLKVHNNEEEDENVQMKEHEKICSVSSSILIQTVLSTFVPLPKSINKMFTGLPTEEILQLCRNAKGSRVIESYINCANVSDDTKLAMFHKLTCDQMYELAVDKFGSRVLDAAWNTSNGHLIDHVRSTLESKRSTLQYNRIGKFIETKFFGARSKGSKSTVGAQKKPVKVQTNTKVKATVSESKNQPKAKKQKIEK